MHRRYTRFHTRVEDLAAYLTAEGVLTDPLWREALHEVPRDLFAPARAYAASFLGDASDRVIDRDADRPGWWDAVYRNYSIISQRSDGTADVTDTTAPATSSLSCPHIALTYLELLGLQDHHRVLEIGTGTGWTAAMLAWRQRSRNVTTIEVDEDLAQRARANLDAAGLKPEVVTGDGASGHPADAPYDRIHVTCGVRDIPYAWIEQTRPGGMIVVPFMPVAGAYGHQLCLDVVDGQTACGRFVGGGGFMMLRAQRADGLGEIPVEVDAQSTTRMDPRLIATAEGGAQLFMTARLPSVAVDVSWVETGDGWAYVATLAEVEGDSWAACTAVRGAGEYDVRQGGRRRLWHEAEAAYQEWLMLGSPDRDRFGLTVTRDGQRIWLDDITI